VLFAPEDLALVRGDPTERRRFLDELLVTRTPRLAGVRSDYDRVLKQRAALLNSAGAARRGGDLSTLDVWDGHLAEQGAQLLQARLAAVRSLRPHAAAAYAQVAPTSVALTLRYATGLADAVSELADPEAVPEVGVLEAALLAELARARPAELDRGVNLVGPHRDDLDLALGELPVRGYASHGEGWSVALSLRLGSYELLRSDALPGGDPVLVLDDVFAELDGERREQLALTAGKAEQSMDTAHQPIGHVVARAGQLLRDVAEHRRRDHGLLGLAGREGELLAPLAVQFGEHVVQDEHRVAAGQRIRAQQLVAA